MLKVHACLSCSTRCYTWWNISLILTRNSSIRSICSVNNNFTKLFCSHVFDVFSLFLERKKSWLVIIYNRHCSFCVFLREIFLRVYIIKNNLEVSIRLPLLIVENLNFNKSFFTSLEIYHIIYCFKIFTDFSSLIDKLSPYTNFAVVTLLFFLVFYFKFYWPTCFWNWIVKIYKTKRFMLVFLIQHLGILSCHNKFLTFLDNSFFSNT